MRVPLHHATLNGRRVGGERQPAKLDVNILENLADKNPGLAGMKLSRFDKVLGLNRERIERIYRGRKGYTLPESTAPDTDPDPSFLKLFPGGDPDRAAA